MSNFSSTFSLAVSEAAVARCFGFSVVDGEGLVSCHFVPTHSPNPSLAPLGERGGLHVAASFKAGILRLTACWPQSGGNSATSRCSQIRRRISSPAVDFSVCCTEAANSGQADQADQALAKRQLASTCLQRIQNSLSQLDGNAPLRTFFPPLKTRPNVAVSSLSAPAGVERVGVRGGIQRINSKNAADNRLGSSSVKSPCAQKEQQKQERTMPIARGLVAKMIKKIGQQPQIAIQELVA